MTNHPDVIMGASQPVARVRLSPRRLLGLRLMALLHALEGPSTAPPQSTDTLGRDMAPRRLSGAPSKKILRLFWSPMTPATRRSGQIG